MFRSTDSQGNIDRIVPFVTWEVDTSAPDTVITQSPAATTNQTTATFFFSGVPAQSGFQCSLDAAPFTGCTSGDTFTGLGPGMHMFEVRAYDAVGNADATPASWTWSIDLAQPNTSITSGPSA
jgi:hypothetical protein